MVPMAKVGKFIDSRVKLIELDLAQFDIVDIQMCSILRLFRVDTESEFRHLQIYFLCCLSGEVRCERGQSSL